jgi:hypothetical protein
VTGFYKPVNYSRAAADYQLRLLPESIGGESIYLCPHQIGIWIVETQNDPKWTPVGDASEPITSIIFTNIPAEFGSERICQ